MWQRIQVKRRQQQFLWAYRIIQAYDRCCGGDRGGTNGGFSEDARCVEEFCSGELVTHRLGSWLKKANAGRGDKLIESHHLPESAYPALLLLFAKFGGCASKALCLVDPDTAS